MGKFIKKCTTRTGRRLLALLLALALIAPMLPVTAEAAELTDQVAMQITTGESAGGDISYIGLKYRDTEGIQHTEYVFPHLGAMSDAFDAYNIMSAMDMEKITQMRAAGVSVESVSKKKAFRPYSSDTLIFDLPFEIDASTTDWFVGLEIFCQGASDQGGNYNWDIQGMRIYTGGEVQCCLAGGMKGEYYLAPYGNKAAEMSIGGKSLSWSEETLFEFSAAYTADVPLTVANSEVPWTAEDDYYTFRIDLADTYNAGVEALVQRYNGNKKLGSYARNEILVMEVQYLDVWGDVIRMNIPVLSSMLLTLNMEASLGNSGITKSFKDLTLLGLAQQGESLVFSAHLPNMARVNRVTFYSGSEAASRVSGLTMNSDREISITNVSVYEGRADGSTDPAPNNAVRIHDSDGNDLNEVFEFTTAPLFYHTANSYIGETIVENGSLTMSMAEYTTGSRLTPVNTNERYLVELKATDLGIYERPDDVYLRIEYRTVKGEVRETSRISVRESANDFYGLWPASTDDFAYKSLMYREGVGDEFGGVKFIVEMRDVEYFSGVTFDTGDYNGDWQMGGIQISRLESVAHREGQWEEVTIGSDRSDRIYSRETVADLIFSMNEKVLVQPDESKDIDFTSGSVVEGEDVEWNDVKYAMSYEESCANLGFTKSRESYTIEVEVCGDTASMDNNGDNGSKNQFFFQLVFENGSSGYVLANQQLSSDGFRSGYTETFTITTNRDYGELVAVSIIPDDMAESSDIYDKLNVEEIRVRRNTTDSISRQWTVSEVGWIGIDYRDDGAGNSVIGQSGRTEAELAHVYPVTYKSYGINLLFNINTGSYDSTTAEANTSQFYGTMTGVLWYTNSAGEMVSYSFDIIEEMYKYANRDPVYGVDQYNQPTTAVNNRDYMFRANHTDRFMISVDDVIQLNHLDLIVTSHTGGTWTFTNVAVQQVLSDGVLQISDSDEYVRTNETQPLCSNVTQEAPESVKMVLPQFTRQTKTVYFSENQIDVDEENFTWVSTVTREPTSQNDEINVYVYPTTYIKPEYDVDVSLIYTTTYGDKWHTGAENLFRTTVSGQQVFTVQGLSASAMSMLNSITIKTDTGRNVEDIYIDHVVVQQVRNGVVIDSYYINCVNQNAAWGFTVKPGYETGTTQNEQEVLLALGTTTEAANLVAEMRDLAVALRYTSSNEATGREYQSPYVFLTDEEYTSLAAGDVLSVTFNEEYVKEITGITLVAAGGLVLDVDCAAVGVYTLQATGEETTERTNVGWYSFAEGALLNNSSVTLKPTPKVPVYPLQMQFQVAPAGTTMESGTNAPVEMTLGYTSMDGSSKTLYIEDLRPYVTSEGRAFATGSLTTVELLLQDVSEIRWMMLEPYDESATSHATLKLSSITMLLGEEGSVQDATRAIGSDVVFEEGAPYRINLSNVVVEASAKAINPNTLSYDKQARSVRSTGSAVKMVTCSDGALKIESAGVSGAVGGVTVTVQQINVTGAAVGAEEELGYSGGAWTFSAPENTTGASLYYRITIASAEVPDVAAVIELEVRTATASQEEATGTDLNT